MRAALLIAGRLLLAAALLVVVGASLGPLSRSCAPALEEAACEGAIDAVLRRGLPGLRPLILAAHVEPGSAPRPGDLGHRATVTFDLLGVPGPTQVALHFDQGGHWGGAADRSETELAAWSLSPLLLASVAAIGLVGATRLRQPRPTAGAAP